MYLESLIQLHKKPALSLDRIIAMSNKPILTPPVKRVQLGHYILRIFGRQAAHRFHRIESLTGKENLPKIKEPIILVGNHQNGMIDGLYVSSMLTRQFHWLTRADAFWNPIFRPFLYSFNHLPIYRTRDKLTDLRERNEIIFNCCIDRMEIGASIALFPEGNHKPQRNVRSIKRGVSDLIGKAYTRHKSLSRLKLIPLGLDYEDYPRYRSRIALRVGAPIEWMDLYDESTQTVDQKMLGERIGNALKSLTTDIQPSEEYEIFEPYVRGLRTTEGDREQWKVHQQELIRIKDAATDNTWMTKVKAAYKNLIEAGYHKEMRVESWGHAPEYIRSRKFWITILKPLRWLFNLPTVLQETWLDRTFTKRKKIEFQSTFKIGAGMFLYPLSWTIMAVVIGFAVSNYEIANFWLGFFVFWSWATWGNKLNGKLVDHENDHADAIEGEEFWGAEKMNTLREAWTNYIDAIKS